LFLGPLTAAAEWVGVRLHDPEGVLALAAFSSIFKSAGILAFYPWLDHFVRLIERISGRGGDSAVSRLDPTVARAGGAVALEAAWRAILEVARGALEGVRGRLAGASVRYAAPAEATQQIERFLESISLDTIDPSGMEPRLVRLCHALDDLTSLQYDLTRVPPAARDWQPPPALNAGARALAGWLDATHDPAAAPTPPILKAVEDAAKELSAARETDREKLLEDLALQRVPVATARAGLETLAWADTALQHAWRLVESLRIASGKEQGS